MLCVHLIENGVNPDALVVRQRNLDHLNDGNGTNANDLWVSAEDSNSRIKKRRDAIAVARRGGSRGDVTYLRL